MNTTDTMRRTTKPRAERRNLNHDYYSVALAKDASRECLYCKVARRPILENGFTPYCGHGNFAAVRYRVEFSRPRERSDAARLCEQLSIGSIYLSAERIDLFQSAAAEFRSRRRGEMLRC